MMIYQEVEPKLIEHGIRLLIYSVRGLWLVREDSSSIPGLDIVRTNW